MKKTMMMALLIWGLIAVLHATELVNENIQNWTSHTSYGSYTQAISAGTVTMTQCIVAPTGAASGTGTSGYVQMQASTGILALPALASAGTVEFRIRAGGTGRSVKLQQYISTTWTDITTFTNIGTTGTTFTYAVNTSSSATLRLATPSAAIYVHDIIVNDYSSGPTLPVLSTAAISSITTTSAVSGGAISSDGGAAVSARGVCWSTATGPVVTGNHSSDGSGSGSFISNITGLTAATQYFVRAYATNSQGTAYGDELSFYSSGVAPPSAPTATAATNVGVNSFTATWNAASGATSYYLDVSLNSGFSSFVGVYNNYSVSGTSQAVSGLTASTTYFYRVRASNSGGTSSSSNTITVDTQAADPYNGYYNSVSGLSGSALKAGLHTLIKNTHTTEYNYDNLEVQMRIADEDPNNSNNVIELYTGWSVPKSSYGAATTDWNKEHTWSKSHGDFGDVAPAGTDLHHLRPCDATVNSFKNNRDFDEGSNAYTDASPPSGYSGTTGCYYNTANDFEPRDEDKGDVARMIFYMATRYEGDDTSYDLELVDYVYSDAGTNQPLYGKLSTLLAWHAQDPPDAWEALRNNRIQGLQGNRNPFIDHPEYVASIWGGSAAPTLIEFNPTSASVNEADGSTTLSVQITNPSSVNATMAQIVLSNGTASDVGNYSTRTITFPAGSSASQNISVTITDDSLLEGNETLTFSLANFSGGTSAAIGTYGSFTLTIADNDIPTVVATSASDITTSGFTATWQAASGISSYLFDLSASSGFGSFVGSYHDYSVTGTTLAITGLNENTSYFYRLKAVYNGSEGSYSNVITATTTGVIYLDAPVALAATAVSHEGFTARWNSVSGATGYRLDVYSGTTASTADLIISEYVEGTSSNKYIELFNGTGASINLSNYKLNLYSNGSATVSTGTTLSGTIASGACVVLQNSAAVLPLPSGVTGINCSAVNFNGDDAVELSKISTSATIDLIGRIGEDPGTAWGTSPLITADRTLRRKSTVLTGVTANPSSGFPTLSTEWGSYATDTSNGLGSHSIGTSSPVAGYQDLAVSTILARVSGLDPNTSYSYVVRAVSSQDTSDNSNTIQVSTTSVVNGTGANTSIGGAATTVLLPVMTGFTNNNLELDPVSTGNDDYSVSTSTFTGGISYSISSSSNSALNGTYILHHDGLGFTPQAARYTLGGNTYQVSSMNATATYTELDISGITKDAKGTLQIDLLRDGTLPVELSSFTAVINAQNNVSLQWVSQSETGMLGYYVLRSASENLQDASVISPLITATNTSQQQCYVYVDEELPQDGTYYYWLQNLDLDGEGNYHGPISVQYSTGSTGNQSPQLITTLANVHPNPFSTGTTIHYSLSKSTQVELKIYNLKGQMVKRYLPEYKNSGDYKLEWNGCDDHGRSCSNGLYFILMSTDGASFVRKVIIAK